jgi:hypothetical protein
MLRSVNNPINIELVETPQGWVAYVAGMDDYESDPHPTPHQALEEVANLLRQFWEAFSVLAEPVGEGDTHGGPG